jgi:hypothetical protein
MRRFGDHAHYRILIVGAGLARLALARTLGQAGFAPELIKGQDPKPPRSSRFALPAGS